MTTSLARAFILTVLMGAVIFFCRVFPFFFFQGKKFSRPRETSAFFRFVEIVVPPAAMTVLTFNALGPSIRELAETAGRFCSALPLTGEYRFSLSALAAALITALLHLIKRNPLISIFGGTLAYMVLHRVM